MADEQLEFLISQYVDGTLAPEERAALEARLRLDADAANLLAEYRALDQALRDVSPMPHVQWDRLSDHLATMVADEPQPRTLSYGRMWGRRLVPLAAAASVLLAVGIAVLFVFNRPDGTEDGGMAAAPEPVTIVQGPQPEAAPGPAIAEISIGPSPTVANSGWPAADTVVSRPSRVIWIASGNEDAQDTRQLPY